MRPGTWHGELIDLPVVICVGVAFRGWHTAHARKLPVCNDSDLHLIQASQCGERMKVTQEIRRDDRILELAVIQSCNAFVSTRLGTWHGELIDLPVVILAGVAFEVGISVCRLRCLCV